MLKADIKPGTEYALREKRLAGAAVERVRIIEYLRGNKWKAEWIEPNPGLVHYVESGQLVSTWRGHRAFLDEEQHQIRLREQNERDGYRKNSPLDRALHEVFESVGDEVQYEGGALSGQPQALARLKVRASVDPKKRSPLGYVDRAGRFHLPLGDAVELARAFCTAEPSTVLLNVETTEREWSRSAGNPGEEHMLGLLNEYRAAWALVRQWAGHEMALAQKDTEIQRLERLVLDAVYALQQAGLDRESARLRRALGKQ